MNKKMSLSADSLSKTYGTKKVVDDISIKVTQSEIVGLLGPNGAGKTTTFYSIVGLIKPDSGVVHIGSENITKLPMYKRARKGIGYLAQEASVFRNLSVRDNILAVLEGTGLSKIQQKERVDSLLGEFSLEGIQNNMGSVLSGGERRRTEIARALAKEPKFILLDEPFAGVDPIAVEEIQNIVYSLKKKNIGILITDHNVDETLSITDRAYLMFEGKLLRSGTSEELASDEQVRKLYLGQRFELKRKL
jgi:lipopolysaccharide export system ATP-binding protein|tara:strand:+ start:3338 stop:4081 length:744 start_codon:yes stop_codon:yes gene_type:complete